MKLYSGPLSLFTAKVRIALDEKQLAYERIEVGWSPANRYLPHHPDVAALNPKKEVPVLIDGDTVVYDSTLIFEYLEDRFPEPPLYPQEPEARADARQTEAHADEVLFPFVWNLIEEVFYPAPAEGRQGGRRKTAIDAIAARHVELDKRLSDRSFLCSDAFGVADIATFVFLNAAGTLGAPVSDSLSALHAWLERVGARPAVAKEVSEMNRYVASLGGS